MRDTREIVNGWIIQYGNRMGKYFRLKDDGLFAVKDENDQEYVVDVPNNSDKVYFCAPIVTLNYDSTRAQDMECVLKWNLWGQETQGGTLSLEEATDRVVFHKIFKVENLDDNSFAEELNRFMQSVDHIKELWQDYRQNGAKPLENFPIDPFFRA